MKKLIPYLLFFSTVACNTSYRCKDPDAVKIFESHLSVVKQMKDHQAFGAQEYFSIFFLEKVTGIASRTNYGDVSIYDNDKLRKSDIKKWNHWFRKNACELKLANLKVVQVNLKSTNPWLILEE